MPSALIVDPNEADRYETARIAEKLGFDTSTAATLKEAKRELKLRTPDVVLIDMGLPESAGEELLAEIERGSERVATIATARDPSVTDAVRAMRSSALDYLRKPIDTTRLARQLEDVGRKARQRELLREKRFGTLIGSSPAMRDLYNQLARVSKTEATVVLIGESGTGKELCAHTVHERSERSGAPFLAVNCGALPESLIESELFGHERGAFSGAVTRRRGVFERAHPGTLFLDEVTEMPLDMQVRLLRVLESSQVTRVGGEDPVAVDVRVVAATNRDPEAAIADGKLREDLWYRLSVFPIVLPPLRDRADDVPLLAEHFLDEHNRREKTAKTFAPETLEALQRCAWPGNVRQLKNAVHRAFIISDGRLEPGDLPALITSAAGAGKGGGTVKGLVGASIADVEKQLILATLKDLDGDKKQAAKTLGISLKTLYNRLKAYRGEDEAPDADED